jgi:hypothetical protein
MKCSIKGECLQLIALNKHYDVVFKPKVLTCYRTINIKFLASQMALSQLFLVVHLKCLPSTTTRRVGHL